MKVFYFGSVCAQEVFNKTVVCSKVKPSASAQSFESALVKGFSCNTDVELTVVSAESIAMYPNGNRLVLKKRQDIIENNVTAHIVGAVNLPAIKQHNHSNGAARALKRWLRENRDISDKCVIIYGIYPSVVKRLLYICHKNRCKIYAIITDVPSTMFTYTRSQSLLKKLFSGSYRQVAIDIQDKFDGYVYLTEAMKDEIDPDKPYTVVETLADTEIFSAVSDLKKFEPSAVMYAGALYKKYGLDMILDSFANVNCDCELWLFGSGDYEQEILKRAEADSRIRYFGRVSREDVLKYEKKATLLLNVRNSEDEYTKFSFPSKMVEYMLSGTPVLTTQLCGIPDEYYDYCYVVKDRNPIALGQQIEDILQDPRKEHIGAMAEDFILKNKNCEVQANKIIRFIKENL